MKLAESCHSAPADGTVYAPRWGSYAPTSANLQSFLNKLMLHTVLTEREQLAFLGLSGARQEINARTTFIHAGGDQTSAYIVLSGLCAQTRVTASGARQITNFYFAGEATGLQGLMVPGATANLYAISPIEVLKVQHTNIRALAFSFPGIAEAIWRHMVWDAAVAAEWIENMGCRDAKARLAHLFCEMAVRSGKVAGNSFSFGFPVTQTQLAEACGFSAVHANRSIRALRQDGSLHMRDGTVVVEDWTSLRATAEFQGEYLIMQPPMRFSALD